MARFDETVALISGGARGMGAGHARALVAEGGRVVIGDVLDDDGRALADELGDAARYVPLDVTDADQWDAAVATAEDAFGPVGLLVNNAGIVIFGPIETTSPDAFRKVVDINLTGVFLGMRATIPSLRRAGGGAIVNVSSTAGMMGYAGIAGYTASKWGVRGMTKTAASEFAADDVRVFSIHPGPISTPMTANLGPGMASHQAIPRMGEPEEVTRLVLFLAAEATYSTGSEWIIDGGALLGPMAPMGTVPD